MSIANRIGLRVAAAAVASGAIVAGGGLAAAAQAAPAGGVRSQTSTSYAFRTLDNARDLHTTSCSASTTMAHRRLFRVRGPGASQ